MMIVFRPIPAWRNSFQLPRQGHLLPPSLQRFSALMGLLLKLESMPQPLEGAFRLFWMGKSTRDSTTVLLTFLPVVVQVFWWLPPSLTRSVVSIEPSVRTTKVLSSAGGFTEQATALLRPQMPISLTCRSPHRKTCGAPRRYEPDVPVSSISRLSLQTPCCSLFRLWLRYSGFP